MKTAESGNRNDITGRAMNSLISALHIEGQIVSSKRKPDMDYLAKYEVECLNEVINTYKDVDSRDLSKLSHKDKAWRAVRRRMREDENDDLYMMCLKRSRQCCNIWGQRPVGKTQETSTGDYILSVKKTE